jgi:hypothetical protein
MRLLNFKPDVVFMNPTEVAKLDLVKTSDGHYIKIETDAITHKVQIIETTEIDVDKFEMLDSAKHTVRVYKDVNVSVGWENDDFRKNLVTILATMRLHSYRYDVNAGAAMYESFSTVRGALEIPAPPAPDQGE